MLDQVPVFLRLLHVVEIHLTLETFFPLFFWQQFRNLDKRYAGLDKGKNHKFVCSNRVSTTPRRETTTWSLTRGSRAPRVLPTIRYIRYPDFCLMFTEALTCLMGFLLFIFNCKPVVNIVEFPESCY